jgi:hypothetical protein
MSQQTLLMVYIWLTNTRSPDVAVLDKATQHVGDHYRERLGSGLVRRIQDALFCRGAPNRAADRASIMRSRSIVASADAEWPRQH